jgi:hypothetical protein
MSLFIRGPLSERLGDCNQKNTVEYNDSRNQIPLGRILEVSRDFDTTNLKRLISRGHGVDFGNGSHFMSPLGEAIEHGNDEGVKVLIQAGANVNGIRGQKSHLMWAVSLGNDLIVSSLLRAGADTRHVDVNGDTALSMCKSPEIKKKLNHHEYLRHRMLLICLSRKGLPLELSLLIWEL